MSNEIWNNSAIQFPRLLAEINACVDISEKDIQALCESMDLDIAEVDELFERAHILFEINKAVVLFDRIATVECPALGCDASNAEIFHHDNEHTHLRCCRCDCQFEVDKNGIIKGR